MRIFKCLYDLFYYEYDLITNTVNSPGCIRETIDRTISGEGTCSHIKKFKWPWQHPYTGIHYYIIVSPGVFTEAITVTQYVKLAGVDNYLVDKKE